MSFDPPAANLAWAKDRSFQFELWSDTGRELAQHFGAATSATQGAAKRVTVLLDAEGKVALRYNVGLDVATHPADVLEDARVLFAPRPASNSP